MERDETLKKIEELYTENLRMKGKTSAAVGWNTHESQELRFNKLTSVVEDLGSPITINDFGCGYGAHLQYLEKCGYIINQYNGYDISASMLETAKINLVSFKGKLNLLKMSKIKTKADYTFVSGTFNVRFEDNNKSWINFIKDKLEEINNFSEKGFSFNLLTTFVDYMESHLFYGDPCYWFNYCKNNFSTKVVLIHDYPLYEWTIIVRK
jgi:SAM-dependent methyltransferase